MVGGGRGQLLVNRQTKPLGLVEYVWEIYSKTIQTKFKIIAVKNLTLFKVG